MFILNIIFSSTWNWWLDKSIFGWGKTNNSWWIWFQGKDEIILLFLKKLEWEMIFKKNNLDIVNQLERRQQGVFNGEFRIRIKIDHTVWSIPVYYTLVSATSIGKNSLRIWTKRFSELKDVFAKNMEDVSRYFWKYWAINYSYWSFQIIYELWPIMTNIIWTILSIINMI